MEGRLHVFILNLLIQCKLVAIGFVDCCPIISPGRFIVKEPPKFLCKFLEHNLVYLGEILDVDRAICESRHMHIVGSILSLILFPINHLILIRAIVNLMPIPVLPEKRLSLKCELTARARVHKTISHFPFLLFMILRHFKTLRIYLNLTVKI